MTHSPLDPRNWPDFRAQAHRMLDDMLNYIEHIRERPVWQPIPDEVRRRLRSAVPEGPSELTDVHAEFMRSVLPYSVGNVHPGFMAYVHGGGTAVGMLAEMLAGGLNANLGGRDHMPVEVEWQITAWLAEIFGFPDTASGLFVTGTSMANFIGVIVARSVTLGPEARHVGVNYAGKRITAYTSAAAHGCIPQAMDLCGLGTDALHKIPVNSAQQMDIDALQRRIAADRAAGATPFLVVGTAGTVDVGAIDNLSALADIAERENLWFHVDGAFGALGILAPDIAPRLTGIERADSLALDFHKWGQVPYDAGFILVRDGDVHRNAFSAPQVYLHRETRGLAAGSPWPHDFGPDLSRGFRALKTWFTLKTFGTRQLGETISRTCALARSLAKRIETTPELELAAPVALNIVCFRYRCADANRMNNEIVIALQEGGIVAPSTTIIDGHAVIRAAIVNHRTEQRDIDALVDEVIRLGRAITHRDSSTGTATP